MAPALALALALAAGVSAAELRVVMDTVAHGSRPEVEKAINRLQFWGSPKQAVAALIAMAQGQTEGSRPNAVYVLSVLHPPEARRVFLALLEEDDATLRLSSCQGLGRLKSDAGSVARIAGLLGDKVAAVRRECARSLGAWEAKEAEKGVLAALKAETDPDARQVEVEALGHVGTAASTAALEALLTSGNPDLRVAAARSLAQVGAPAGRKAVEGWATSAQADERSLAVTLLAQLPDRWSTDALAGLLGDPVAAISVKASQALIARHDPRGLRSLVVRSEKAVGDDKFAFESALMELKITQPQRLDILQAAGAVK
jgi:HEAT repeat protein